MSRHMKRKGIFGQRMIPDSEFYQHFFDTKAEELALEKRKVEALESIAKTLETFSAKYLPKK